MMNQPQEPRIDIHKLLARHSLLHELTQQQIEQIVLQTREKRLAKGEMLFQKGDSSRGFYVVIFGQLKLAFPSSCGNEKVVDILGPMQSFGEAVMFMDRPYPLFAQAISDTLLLHVTKDAVLELLAKDPLFARNMLAGLSMRLHTLLQDVESYSMCSSAQRVIGYLLQLCPHEQGAACQGSFEITLPISKQIIASRLNLTPETLSRVFHDFAAANLISVQGKQVTINDLKRLREYNL